MNGKDNRSVHQCYQSHQVIPVAEHSRAINSVQRLHASLVKGANRQGVARQGQDNRTQGEDHPGSGPAECRERQDTADIIQPSKTTKLTKRGSVMSTITLILILWSTSSSLPAQRRSENNAQPKCSNYDQIIHDKDVQAAVSDSQIAYKLRQDSIKSTVPKN